MDVNIDQNDIGAQQLVQAYVRVKSQLKEHGKISGALKEEEKRLTMEVRDYMNQHAINSIRVDEDTTVSVCVIDKKVARKSKSLKPYLTQLLAAHQVYDAMLIDEIMAAKVENTFQEQKLKMVTGGGGRRKS